MDLNSSSHNSERTSPTHLNTNTRASVIVNVSNQETNSDSSLADESRNNNAPLETTQGVPSSTRTSVIVSTGNQDNNDEDSSVDVSRSTNMGPRAANITRSSVIVNVSDQDSNNDSSLANDSRNENALSAEIQSIIERIHNNNQGQQELSSRYQRRSGPNYRFHHDSDEHDDDEYSPGNLPGMSPNEGRNSRGIREGRGNRDLMNNRFDRRRRLLDSLMTLHRRYALMLRHRMLHLDLLNVSRDRNNASSGNSANPVPSPDRSRYGLRSDPLNANPFSNNLQPIQNSSTPTILNVPLIRVNNQPISDAGGSLLIRRRRPRSRGFLNESYYNPYAGAPRFSDRAADSAYGANHNFDPNDHQAPPSLFSNNVRSQVHI